MSTHSSKKRFSVSELPRDYDFNGLDLLKFICAFLICALHIPPISSNTAIAIYVNTGFKYWLCRIAVPFYFTVSGFLLFRKIDLQAIDLAIVKRYCFRVLRLLGTWYFLLFVGKNVHLWYMGALVLAVLFLTVLLKANFKINHIILLSVLLYLIGMADDSYYGILEPLRKFAAPRMIVFVYREIFETTRNGIFFGFIFVLMGALFAHKKIIMSNTVAYLGFSVSMIFLFAEAFLLNYFTHTRDSNMYVFLLPAVFFLFYIASHIKLKESALFKRMRIVGMLVFYLHFFAEFFVDKGIYLLIVHGIDFTKFKFFFVIFAVTLLAVIIERLSQKRRFRWLKYIYS